MNDTVQTTAILEGGLDAIKEASSHLDSHGIRNSFTTAVGCKPGS